MTWRRVLLAAASFVICGEARAWEPINPRWSTWCDNIPFRINEAGSTDLGIGVSQSELTRAFSDWQNISCTTLAIAEPTITTAEPGVFEGKSVVGWVESNWRHAPEAIGVTGTLATQNVPSCITEADMELNGVHYTWTLEPGSGSRVNAFSIALHEGGHYLGLGHSSDGDAAMYYAYQGGVDELGTDDINGICSLYPSPEADCTSFGCPRGQRCVSGACEFAEGDGSLCAPCQRDADCGGENDFCLSYPDGLQYCGRYCESDVDCPADDEFCARTNSLSQCARVDDEGDFSCRQTVQGCAYDTDCPLDQRCEGQICVTLTVDGAELGESCESNDDCRHGLCALSDTGRVCSRTCDWLRSDSCNSAGRYCAATATGTCSVGLCLSGVAGSGSFASACSRDTDCESLFCIEGRCSVPCSGTATAACPAGAQCLSTSLSGCQACAPPKKIGDPCRSFEECPDRLCVEEPDVEEPGAEKPGAEEGNDTEDATRAFCTTTCLESSECPDGSVCEDVGNVRICQGFAGRGPSRSGGDRRGCSCAARAPDPGHAFFGVLWMFLLKKKRRRR